jgi:hypothetical protein
MESNIIIDKQILLNPKFKRFELVEVPVAANATGQVKFPTLDKLRNQANQIIIIKSISIYPITAYANSQTTNTVPGMAATEIPKTALVLYVDGEESIRLIPTAQLININDGTVPFQQQIQPFDDLTDVIFDSSYFQFNAPAAATAYVIPVGIVYIRLKKNPANPNEWIEK